jgi:hypothetical protein
VSAALDDLAVRADAVAAIGANGVVSGAARDAVSASASCVDAVVARVA